MLRFAISPTADMDLNNLRVAIFNYLVAKQQKEALLIRIDDTNKEKNIEGKEKEILELLSLFSIDYANAVYQSENLKYHQKLAMQLMGQKKAFACFCGDEKLEELKQKAKAKGKVYNYDGFCETLSDETVLNCNASFTVRIQKPKENISFKDTLKGDLEYKPFNVDSFVILNHDKSPTYDYACALDDMLYDISTVIRDEEYLQNSAKQIHIRKLINYDKELNYIHLPKLNNTQLSVKELIDEGFLPSAIANYLVLLGNETPEEIFTLEDAVKWFDITKVSKDVSFDLDELKQINKKHLKALDEMRLSKILGFADADIGKLGKLFLDEAYTINEIKVKTELVFALKSDYLDFEDEFKKLKHCLKEAPYFEDFEDLKKYIIEKTAIDEINLSKPLRYILTGNKSGPELSKIYPLIKNYLGEIIK